MKSIAIIIAILFSGCAGVRTYTGDFSVFLIETLESHGAKLPKKINRFENLPIEWQYKTDEYGIVINAPLDSFSAIDFMLRDLFGEPQLWDKKNLVNGQHGVYSWRAIGCVIQYLEDVDQVTLIIMKKPR